MVDPDLEPDEYGPHIRGERVACGISLRQLAAGLRMDPVILGRVERGERAITEAQLEHILERLAIMWEGAGAHAGSS